MNSTRGPPPRGRPRGPRGCGPTRGGPQQGGPRVRDIYAKMPLNSRQTNPQSTLLFLETALIQKNHRTFLLFTMVRPSTTRTRVRRGGNILGRPRRPARTRASSTNGLTPVYNPSAYTSLGYRSGRARGSGDHGVQPCVTAAQPCRPP